MTKRMLIVAALLLAALLLSRCWPAPNQYDSLQLRSISQLHGATIEPAPLLGLALGGGGVRGFVHLGVIKALDEAGIEAAVVVGSSAGAIAAALYASGKPYGDIESTVLALREWHLADPVISRQGVVNGQALAQWINDFVADAPIESLPIRSAYTVTDLQRGDVMLVTAGDTGHAVQASSTIPGVFLPVQSNGSTLVDGGALALAPVLFARALGAQIVLAVDIYCGAAQPIEHNIVNTLLAVFRLQSCEITAAQLDSADIVISPDFEPESFRSFSSRDAAIAAGYAATWKIIPQLRRLLADRRADNPEP